MMEQFYKYGFYIVCFLVIVDEIIKQIKKRVEEHNED
jgi:hypothetical protein